MCAILIGSHQAAIDAGAACEVLAIDAMPRVIAARMNA